MEAAPKVTSENIVGIAMLSDALFPDPPPCIVTATLGDALTVTLETMPARAAEGQVAVVVYAQGGASMPAEVRASVMESVRALDG
jgi:hypothetical protein